MNKTADTAISLLLVTADGVAKFVPAVGIPVAVAKGIVEVLRESGWFETAPTDAEVELARATATYAGVAAAKASAVTSHRAKK